MELETEVTKSDHFGWTAETRADLGPANNASGETGRRILEVRTIKRNGILETTATVIIEVKVGITGLISRQYSICGKEYYKRLLSAPVKMATEKRVREHHAAATITMPAIIEEARAHNPA